MLENLVIYHGNCADGMGAAWAAFHHFGNQAEYRVGVYGEEFPNLDQFRMRCVYLVDFTYSPNQLRQIASVASRVVILDHHRSAMLAFKGEVFSSNVWITFNMEKSGARLAWEHFHEAPAPKLIQYIEDRDLWHWKLDNSHAINAFIRSFDFSMNDYKILHLQLESPIQFKEAITVGEYLLHQQRKSTNGIAKNAYLNLLGSASGTKRVMFINTCSLTSEVGNQLLTDDPSIDFVAGWFDLADRRVWSLRSADKFDCSELAKLYGGGGHPNAAGFTTSTRFMLQEIS
jgi:oligoribonuclease NrnB/cAMP/cGMP phosphodiesterase (DHH superfamily)